MDSNLLQAGEYLMEAAHLFRLQQKNFVGTGEKKIQGKVKVIKKPIKATVWVAQTYPPWQTTILETLKQLFRVSNSL